MYPVGSNGASQAILDARALADALVREPDVRTALRAYQDQRLEPTAEIVRSNRSGGPERVIDAVEARAPEGFDEVEDVLSYAEREAIVRGYASKAGFAVPSAQEHTETTIRRKAMGTLSQPDVIGAVASLDGMQWNILGQTYRPKQLTEHSFAWHATMPADSFVPPHIHPTQDEYVYLLEGELTLVTESGDSTAGPGDLVRLPRGKPHGLFNRSGATVACLFWVTPTARLYDLFVGIDALAQQTPEAVVALSAEHEVEFLPPPEQ
jgi:quercetin dioxygenase-like cupin family protein